MASQNSKLMIFLPLSGEQDAPHMSQKSLAQHWFCYWPFSSVSPLSDNQVMILSPRPDYDVIPTGPRTGKRKQTQSLPHYIIDKNGGTTNDNTESLQIQSSSFSE